MLNEFGFWDKIIFTIIAYGILIHYYIKIPLQILGIVYLIKIIKRIIKK